MTVTLPLLVWVATILTVVVIDLGGYLVAASRAQSLADSAALAAVSVNVVGVAASSPAAEAAAVVELGGGRMESCRCPPRAEVAHVAVSVPVPGLVMPAVGAARVEAEASAVLAPPADLSAGPTHERARWGRPSLD